MPRLPSKPKPGFNTQPPEGGCRAASGLSGVLQVSTHSHPKVAAKADYLVHQIHKVSTHSHPKVAACHKAVAGRVVGFQHTATRRWLLVQDLDDINQCIVSTHSHPKVAAQCNHVACRRCYGFNTQPPEGGCLACKMLEKGEHVSTHSHPKVAAVEQLETDHEARFQHTATRRWLLPLSKALLHSGFAAPISPNSQEKRKREYNTAFSVTPKFAIS